MRAWRWQDLAVGVAGLAVLVASLTPWYVSGWAGPGPDDYHTSTANAWQSSTWWSAGVLIALLATGWRLLTHRLPWLPPLGALLGLGVVVWIWSRIGPMPTTLGWAASGPDSRPDSGYGVVRDELFRLHEPGRDLDTGWGLYFGVAVLGLLTLLLVVPRRPTPPPGAAPLRRVPPTALH
jgi:hypothetical protein